MGIGFPWLIVIVAYVLAVLGVSWWFWDCLSWGEPSVSATIRNLVLIGGTPLAMGLAVWRSTVAQRQSEVAQKQAETAQKQAEIAQGGLLSNRYQRAVEMLGNDLLSVRVGGVRALKNIALEHYDEYQGEVLEVLDAYYSIRDVDIRSTAATHGIMGMSPAETQEALIKEREEQLEEKERQSAIEAIRERGERIKSERLPDHLTRKRE